MREEPPQQSSTNIEKSWKFPLQKKLNKIYAAVKKGSANGELQTVFVVLCLLQSLLCMVAWVTSSGYEDSAIPYILQALLGCVITAMAVMFAWLAQPD
jgi:hypothetical protein